jgi:hypothetical protein
MTKGEFALQQFCKENAIKYTRITESHEQTPDYQLTIGELAIIVEVKDIEMNDEEKDVQEKKKNDPYCVWGSNSVGSRVRDKISKANRQLKKLMKGKIPSMLVLFDARPSPFNILSPYEIKVAMYGFETYDLSVPKDFSPPFIKSRRFGKGKRTTPEHNTSTSAISILRLDYKTNRYQLDIYHNHFSTAPLSSVSLKSFNAVTQFTLNKNREDDFGEWETIKNSS